MSKNTISPFRACARTPVESGQCCTAQHPVDAGCIQHSVRRSTYGNLHTLLICKLLVQILHAHGRSDDHWEAKIALYLRSIWYELHKAITAAAAEMAQMAFFEYTRGTTTQNALYAAIIMHFSAIRGKIMWLFCKTRQSGFISRFFQDFQVSRVFACGGAKFNFNPYRFLLLFYSFVQSKKIECS